MIVGFYGRTFGGSAKIPLENFDLWEKRAISVINRILARDISLNLCENAKMCICEVAELLFDFSKRNGIISENIDGYSVRFDSSKLDSQILAIIKNYLSGDEILYRGDVL